MTKKFLITMLAGVLLANVCAAQSSNTNWGESVNGVQLSISLNTNVLVVGSSTSVQCTVKNSSTNVIGWGVINVTQGFDVSLTNSSGQIYFLTPQRDTNATVISVSYSLFQRLKIGGTYTCSVPINVGKEIKPGNYQLEAKQFFSVFRKLPLQKYELVSNPLEVQVK